MKRVEKVVNITRDNNGAIVKEKIEAIADTKAEVLADNNYVGLPQGVAIDFGSKVVTAKLEIGFMKSNGTWEWS